MRTSDLVAASIVGVQERHGKKFASPELYLGTQIRNVAGRQAGHGTGSRRHSVGIAGPFEHRNHRWRLAAAQ